MMAEVRFAIQIFVRSRSDRYRGSGQHIIDPAAQARMFVFRCPQGSIYGGKNGLNTRAIGLGITFCGTCPELIATKAAPHELVSTSA